MKTCRDRRIWRAFHWSQMALFAPICLLALACSPKPQNVLTELPPAPLEAEVTLEPGDVIEVDFVYWPELDTTQAIRSDGKVSFGELGEVVVAGMSTAKLSAFLVEGYRGILRDPVINVLLRSRAPRHVYVGGEVRNPGILTLIPMANHMVPPASGYALGSGRVVQRETITLDQAIMAVGGFIRETANRENVVVIRYIDGQRHVAAFDLESALESGERGPVVLAANDVVFVPRSKIDKIDQWIDQHISQIIPDTDLTWSFTRISDGGDRRATVGINP